MMRSKSSSIMISALALALVLAVGSATAQSSVSLTADIPFEFMAGNATMPAGAYTLHSLGSSPVVAIAADDRSSGALVLTNGAHSVTLPEQARLVFHKYGDRYFLAEIWSLGNREGHRLAVTGTERELSKRAANSEVVAILAKR